MVLTATLKKLSKRGKVMSKVPTLSEVEDNWQRLKQWIVETPVWHYRNSRLQELVGNNTQIFFKLELLQITGSFKARGAITTLLHLNKEELRHGVVAATAGNHGIAVSYAAKVFGTTAKIVMPKTASPLRIERCKNYGAEVILVDTIHEVFPRMQEIANDEGRTCIHPFEGQWITMGTGSIGLELAQQIKTIDAVIIPVGGGGLSSGISLVIKQLLPDCQVFGVEPAGAPTLYESLKAGKPMKLAQISTIADSLAVPQAMPFSFSICQQYLDEIVLVNDEAIRNTMQLLMTEMKLAVEPAAAISLAALCGPLRQRLQGKRVALIISGTNIDVKKYCHLIEG